MGIAVAGAAAAGIGAIAVEHHQGTAAAAVGGGVAGSDAPAPGTCRRVRRLSLRRCGRRFPPSHTVARVRDRPVPRGV